ncbi:hypothetical protein [Maricaulis sp.]|uniref:hypothetical protein n=1 Tax=Maricaulis sp. TaxID=1486257 RepID=UPI003A8E26A0
MVFVIGPIGLFLIIALLVVGGRTKGLVDKTRHDFEIEKARWERENGRSYPYAHAEVIEVWKTHQKKAGSRLLGALAIGSGSLALFIWGLVESNKYSRFSVLHDGDPWMWQLLALIGLVGMGYGLVRIFTSGKMPPMAQMMREMEDADGQRT